VPPPVAIGVAVACFAGAVLLYRHRGTTLRLMTRLRGLDRSPVGPRRRYQYGWSGQWDMALPVLALLVVGAVFLVRGLVGLA
jgi:hypothetical protein